MQGPHADWSWAVCALKQPWLCTLAPAVHGCPALAPLSHLQLHYHTHKLSQPAAHTNTPTHLHTRTHTQASYSLSEAEYSAGEYGEGWAGRLLLALEAMLLWLQPLLTTNNYEVGAALGAAVSSSHRVQ